jgi:hypothetical protein
MKSVIRALVVLIAALATFYFVLWLPFWFLLPVGRSPAVRIPVAVVCALAVTRYVWRRRHGASLPRGLIGSVGAGAVVTGVVGFSVGFVGPMIFAPSANQGPMLGIFLTGPLGVVAGAVGGGIYWLARGRRAAKNKPGAV